MFIELVDALRCPNSHEDSWLVASADTMEARHIVTGALGCPVCTAQFPIVDGVVDFRRERDASEPAEAQPADSYKAMKLAALLDLSDASGFVVLTGAWGALAGELANLVETPIVAVNPPASITGAPGISVLRSDDRIPLASAVARAVAVSGENEMRTAEAVRIVKSKARVVAPVEVPVPADVKELARDEEIWVGEREAAPSPLVTLHVRRA